MNNLSSVSTLISLCMILRSVLSLRQQANMALAYLRKFFDIT